MAWAKGLLMAIIIAAGNTVAVIDTSTFSFNAGGKKLLTLIGINALIAAGAYLKQSPLPGSDPDAKGVAFRNK